ncbi:MULTISPECIES: prolipoprotein diacylglyceryl transferase [unclassified Streptococcus]|uniref:prolipoprotein diacylglyceryl transferase n=1 Tax=unclassified Streptococcus TaxID=2608887 RepID=UPI00107287A9|nr:MULTISPECIES: prolipoprotein diacylglyceryl transferase [unclassified Streptococcus]MBF0788236.1 prolipoprotein diacylglyceryl transferase [Streptococcus sp. 19428wC2_LYSM12]MCQ9212189.1 prolipoprotein diacylglyceryl transferase [Streptococcus sp. B01]MCQ9213519.1 prolipoprotein diacylglyceryl transferase [Streptococcus sp. O1]TFV04703.1 prolipoprotein diacylglyceryl transferase [Streptococcus sp. LYSM12]
MIDPVAVTLGPLEIRWYALCIITGLVLAVFLASKEAPRKKILAEDIFDFILLAFPLAILGARIYYVAFSWDLYKDNLLSVFAIWEGGIAIYGGLLMGFIVLVLFTRHRFIETWDFLDVVAPSVMIAQAIGRWGNFFNQEAYGASVTHLDYVPDFIRKQMYIDGSYRTPTFLYESLWNLLGFVLIYVLRRHKRLLKQGEITLFYLVWYGAGRFVIEGMRTDSLMLLGLRISQWLSALLIVLALILGIYRRRKDLPYYQD